MGQKLNVTTGQFLNVATSVHYHGERNHQGLNNSLIEPSEEVGRTAGKICCHERLGGMVRYYYRDAA